MGGGGGGKREIIKSKSPALQLHACDETSLVLSFTNIFKT